MSHLFLPGMAWHVEHGGFDMVEVLISVVWVCVGVSVSVVDGDVDMFGEEVGVMGVKGVVDDGGDSVSSVEVGSSVGVGDSVVDDSSVDMADSVDISESVGVGDSVDSGSSVGSNGFVVGGTSVDVSDSVGVS